MDKSPGQLERPAGRGGARQFWARVSVLLSRQSPDEAAPRNRDGMVALLGLCDLDGAEALERGVDEEDLHRDVGLDVGLAAS
jgi:hypothetical protein